MRSLGFAIVAVTVALGAPATTLAHHSFAMFDRDREVVLTGTIKEFQFTNPHSWVQLNVTGADAGTWAIETLPVTSLSRLGWRRDTLKPGDRVTVRIHPMKDKSKGGNLRCVTRADGKVLMACPAKFGGASYGDPL
jgi:hypothetical protein